LLIHLSTSRTLRYFEFKTLEEADEEELDNDESKTKTQRPDTPRMLLKYPYC
jgi:hypothetical protein